MGFDFDAYKSAGNYITAPEKKVIADSGIPFSITAVRKTFKFDNEHYELTIIVPNPETGDDEERTLSFPIGSGAESRDRMLGDMAEYLAGGGDPVTAKLDKVGRAYFLAQA